MPLEPPKVTTTSEPYQIMPPLPPEEYAALEASITESGVQVPIVVDEDGLIIDGHHRRQIAASLGIDCPTSVRVGLTALAKRTLAGELNTARRHLTRDQRVGLIEASLRADPELSNRAHGRCTGVDHKTVESVRQRLQSTGEIPRSMTRRSADGRERPATQPDRAVARAQELTDKLKVALAEVDAAVGEAMKVDPDGAAALLGDLLPNTPAGTPPEVRDFMAQHFLGGGAQ